MTASDVQQIPGIEWSEVGARVTDDLSFEQWEEVIRRALRVGDAARWWVGDLLIQGEQRFGEKFAQAVAELSPESRKRYIQVCAAVGPGRRRPNLSYSHHREVASLAPETQETLLDRAEKEGWTTDELRERVRDARGLTRLITGQQKPRQEVLGPARTTGAAAALATVKESLGTTYRHLRDPEKVTAVQAAETIAPAVRAIDEAAATLTAAAKVVDIQNALDRAARYYREALREIIAVTHWDDPDIEKIRALAAGGIRAADHELEGV